MAIIYANDAQTTLASGITAVQTTITVAAGTGSMFPNPTAPDYLTVTLQNASGTYEICKCTNVSGDVLTVVRAQEGTAGFAFASGDKVECRPTAGGLANKLDKDTGGTLGSNTLAQALALVLNTAVGNSREILFQTAGSNRWLVFTTGESESGSNAGSNFEIQAYSDAGALLSTPLVINRATGNITASGSFNAVGGILSGGTALCDVSSVQTLTNKTLTDPHIATLTPDGTHTLTMPAVTDQLVGRATTDTLTNKTLSGAAVTSSIFDDAGGGPFRMGFRDVPVNPQNGAYTLTPADAGKGIYSNNTGAQTITVAPHSTEAIAIGAMIDGWNNGTGAITISPGSGVTIHLAGGSSTGARTVAAGGFWWMWQPAQNIWVVGGVGVT